MRRLVFRSLLVLGLLFGLLYAVGTALLYKLRLPLGWAVGFSVVVVALQYLLGPYLLRWFFKIHWVGPWEISPELETFLQNLCRQRGICVPRLGLIEDGQPNAFTFGHFPGNARIVLTRGLVEMLSPEELQAVVAHEVGHVAHYDFFVMALASVVPLVLYNLYQWTRRQRSHATWVVACGAYCSYLLSQLAVLVLSRIREYFADEHAVESVRDANAISRALVKIAYGMARLPQEPGRGKDAPRPSRVAMVGALGIGEGKGSGALALASADGTGAFSAERMGRAMRWDLWNPAARWFELFSTHPLVARRVAAASKLAVLRGQVPLLPNLGEAPRNLWPAFLRDLLINFLPWSGLAAGLLLLGRQILAGGADETWSSLLGRPTLLGVLLLLSGLGWALRLAFSYRKGAPPRQVADLLAEWDVSQVKGLPAELEGTIIGRGVPGLYWSKDLVLQDATGFITVVYRQPFAFLETLFGLLRAGDLVGRDVKVRGWYRRGPGPSFEAGEMAFADGTVKGCYHRHAQWIYAALLITAGAALLIF